MTARTDRVRSIVGAKASRVLVIDEDDGGVESLVAIGQLSDFRCAFGNVREVGEDIALSAGCATLLDVREDDVVLHVPRW